jgi:hypothetical protein
VPPTNKSLYRGATMTKPIFVLSDLEFKFIDTIDNSSEFVNWVDREWEIYPVHHAWNEVIYNPIEAESIQELEELWEALIEQAKKHPAFEYANGTISEIKAYKSYTANENRT